MQQDYFITGVGTGIGKTLVSAILAEALEADYWKPVQAGVDKGTDREWVQSMISNTVSKVHPESYKLRLAASPHIAARKEKVSISIKKIKEDFQQVKGRGNRSIIIEGAGGIMVPLNEKEFVADLVKELNCKVILVSRNYLGSINHSLLTARFCKQTGLDVAGWIFNDQYLDYEKEIEEWSGYPILSSVKRMDEVNQENIRKEALLLSIPLTQKLATC